jgi:glycosyltransferase involved in cell wall biosynthesis
MNKRPRLLLLSAVWPFPGHSGQQQRVYYKLKAFRERFHVTFLTFAPAEQQAAVRARLLSLCDEALVLPSCYHQSTLGKVWHRLRGGLNTVRTGLKFSNYVIGRVELSPQRVARVLQGRQFDCGVFEYWHAAASVEAFHRHGIPCVLDMHDVLWQSYRRQLAAKRWLPGPLRDRAVRRYRAREEAAWEAFDALIAINAAEQAYVREQLPHKRLFYAPMGVDLEQWPYSWQPAAPPRVAYYGGLGSPHNRRDALRCYEEIMPRVWDRCPRVELWLVGSNPPPSICALVDEDERVHVTGYVEDVQSVLRTMTAVLCPWTGRYGFRSRLVEVMALGVPVVATPDAVYGMNLEVGKGLFLGNDDKELAQFTLEVIGDSHFAEQQSKLAQRQIKQQFSYGQTYARLASQLLTFTQEFQDIRSLSVPATAR